MAAPPLQPVPPPAAVNGDAFRLGFIGAGNLAESIARGVAASGVLPASAIRTAPHRRPERGAAFASIGACLLDTNAQVVDDSDVIVISVKPQIGKLHPVLLLEMYLFRETEGVNCSIFRCTCVLLIFVLAAVLCLIVCTYQIAVKQVLLELKPLLSDEKLLVSIAAGIKMKDLQDWSGQRRIIRVMPNTPSAVGQAASAEEKYFDAVTGLSGPAYIFLAIEAMADGGVAAGLPRELALGLASQTVLGAATMVSETGKHPGQLKDQVTSPAGTTIAGVQELEKGAFRGTLISAVVAAAKRCRELS
ncbi:hypothetical protein HU200_065511 [Digitaria exilis]|uniref:Pyrroline-5-carboxylate reductase n=1 Tax=Digitaria exilis TaxID=1010633 RepID=A0A834ZY55_9POAL|nr:hypothetical protein HU200_065511 [Digitaria exilis]